MVGVKRGMRGKGDVNLEINARFTAFGRKRIHKGK
jgi:hypothetical protein